MKLSYGAVIGIVALAERLYQLDLGVELYIIGSRYRFDSLKNPLYVFPAAGLDDVAVSMCESLG